MCIIENANTTNDKTATTTAADLLPTLDGRLHTRSVQKCPSETQLKQKMDFEDEKRMPDETWRDIVQSIRKNEDIYLELGGKLDATIEHEWKSMLSELRQCTFLRELDMVANAMRDSHMAALVDVLLTLPRLTYLDVSSNQFRVSTLQRLVDDNRLRVISATNTSLFGDGKLDSFVRSLQSNTSLFSLGVSECSLMPEEGIALVTYLRGSHTLQELSIHGNFFDEAVAERLALALRENTTLTLLHASNTDFGDAGSASLLHALPLNRSLRFFEFRVTSDELARELMSTMQLQNTITSYAIDFINECSEEQLCSFLKSLEQNTIVTKLLLFPVNNIGMQTIREVDDSTGEALAELIQNNRTLRVIRFYFSFNVDLILNAMQNNFTLLDSSFTESGDDDDDDLVELYIERFSAVHKRNQQLFWPNVCVVIVDVCIALASLCLPPYVLLWIVDWLPNYEHVSHHKKIRLIESIVRSINALRGDAEEM